MKITTVRRALTLSLINAYLGVYRTQTQNIGGFCSLCVGMVEGRSKCVTHNNKKVRALVQMSQVLTPRSQAKSGWQKKWRNRLL